MNAYKDKKRLYAWGKAMNSISEVLKNSKKIVIKLGSHVISTDDGMPDREAIENLVEQVASFMGDGKQVVIVSSGAGVCGVGAINKWSRRTDLNYKQALCAIGQVELMMAYKEYFAKYNMHVGQLLLTREDFTNSERELRIRNTLFTLVDEGIVPIINENDSVCIEEMKIGDNDNLGALTANIWNADVLVILSDIDGIFDKNPKLHNDAKLVGEIHDIKSLMENIDIEGISDFGTGGIKTKIEAATRAGKYAIPTILLNGSKKNIIVDARDGKERGSIFLWK